MVITIATRSGCGPLDLAGKLQHITTNYKIFTFGDTILQGPPRLYGTRDTTDDLTYIVKYKWSTKLIDYQTHEQSL